MERFVCIHGHFDQPPRENPWLDTVELQDSAYPHHDWNERVTTECYAPNAVARLLDEQGRIWKLVNNYARISFGFGPSLLAWLEKSSPEVYQAILDADQMAKETFSGHGSALAQPYVHIPLPLVQKRDKRTLLQWGLTDFENRFGRPAEGMWLPEGIADIETLELLADLGIRFTVLAPSQVARVRPIGDSDWIPLDSEAIDPTQAYLHPLPSGRSLSVFLYDGPISRGIGPEVLHWEDQAFANRIYSGFSDARDQAQLVSVATTGEQFGHHVTHGDMALALTLQQFHNDPHVQLTVYGEFLDLFPPTQEIEIHDPAQFSRQDNAGNCDLSAATYLLLEETAALFEHYLTPLIRDPWEARDDFASVIFDRSEESWERFWELHRQKMLTDEDRIIAGKLLEVQRMVLLSLTGSIWQCAPISSLEAIQALRFADRALQLCEEVHPSDLSERFLKQLESATDQGPLNGREVYEKSVRPTRVEWEHIGAHYAIRSLFETYPETATLFCYQIKTESLSTAEAGRAKLIHGQVEMTSLLTRDSVLLTFGFIHFGDHHVNGGVRYFQSSEEYQELAHALGEGFERADFAEVIRVLDRYFVNSFYSLKSLFRDEQRRIIRQVLEPTLNEAETMLRRLHENHQPLMQFLSTMEVPYPQVFQSLADFLVRTDLGWELQDEELRLDKIRELMERAQNLGMELDVRGLGFRLKGSLSRIAERWHKHPLDLKRLQALSNAVEMVKAMPLPVDLWQPQNTWWELSRTSFPEQLSRLEEGEDDAVEWLEAFVRLGEKLEVRVSELEQQLTDAKDRPEASELIEMVFRKRRTPRATYRFQFHQGFTFSDAKEKIPYLAELGISDVYASPILQARPGSPHGYDICRHDRINPEIGGEEGLDELVAVLHEHGMGLVLDTVPNHVGINHESNEWWMDVLENGPSSIHAHYFDIDWEPVNPNLADKVLLPVLEDHYGKVLEKGLIRLGYDNGAFHFQYHDHRWPVSPNTYAMILEPPRDQLEEQLGDEDKNVQELSSILTALSYLPPSAERDPEKITERNREKEIIKDRLRTLVEGSEDVGEAIEQTVRQFNGTVSDPASFDQMDELLDRQAFRPAYWRVATEEINYRRFFDVNDLAAIRVEDPEVFEATHALLIRLLAEGKANGLRIDHPDGLWNPTEYFRDLQKHYVIARARELLAPKRLPDQLRDGIEAELESRWEEDPADPTARPLYVVAEKILCEGEELPRDWPIDGTSGYDFLNLANGLFIDSASKSEFQRIHTDFCGKPMHFHSLVNETKKTITFLSMASEINALSHQLDRISERNRLYRDFTLNSLTSVIREILTCLPVYRTYVTGPGPDSISVRDQSYVDSAVTLAKQLNPQTAELIFDFVRDVLLLRIMDDFREEDRRDLIAWTMKFQQVTGPIMAKGVEDTALYVYNRFVSLNEVGGEPEHFGSSVIELHASNSERAQSWPSSMIATSTHDTKRSEDVRTRLDTLSEMPQEWESALSRWSEMNASKKTEVDGQPAPDANDEYLLYQTLLGTWPLGETSKEDLGIYRERVVNYLQKATREAKVHTSWINANVAYDNAVRDFVQGVISDDSADPFVNDLMPMLKTCAWYGALTSLAQVTLKLTSPGVPDVYQGNELWDFSLVDPDNRRPVDYFKREQWLRELKDRISQGGDQLAPLAMELMEHVEDGRAKLFLTHQILTHRREHPSLFEDGSYHSLELSGEKSLHGCAYLRKHEDRALVVVVPRLIATLVDQKQTLILGEEVWQDTRVTLPEALSKSRFVNLFTRETLEGNEEGLLMGDLLKHFPVAVLECTTG